MQPIAKASMFISDNVEEEGPEEDYAVDPDDAEEIESLREASSKNVRDFAEVLNQLITEFGYDLKTGQVPLSNLAIRKVEVSEAIPNTYTEYIELLVSEQIHNNTNIKLINCLPCHTRATRLINNKLLVTSPTTNIGELKLAAEQLGIQHFMDVVLMYHSTHMVLGFQIFKADTKETIWAKSYNSELIRSRYQGLAIDFNQINKSRSSDTYVPEYRTLLGFGGATVPNLSADPSDSGMVAMSVRSTERFNNRRTDFGLMLNAYMRINSLVRPYPVKEGTGGDGTSTTDDPNMPDASSDFNNPAVPQPFNFALSIMGLYAHNFLGSVESYNQIRQGLSLGMGVLLTPGYLAGTGHLGWDMYFGRRYALNFAGLYISSSKISLAGNEVATTGGYGFQMVMSFNF